MYDQLKQLEKTLFDIKRRYQSVNAELECLKRQPSADPKELTALKSKLDASYAERDSHKKQLGDLDNRYQSLAEAHHMIGEEHDTVQKQLAQVQQENTRLQHHNQQLEQQNKDIKQQNNDLQEKNQLAAERTQVVLNRLTRIDRMDG